MKLAVMDFDRGDTLKKVKQNSLGVDIYEISGHPILHDHDRQLSEADVLLIKIPMWLDPTEEMLGNLSKRFPHLPRLLVGKEADEVIANGLPVEILPESILKNGLHLMDKIYDVMAKSGLPR